MSTIHTLAGAFVLIAFIAACVITIAASLRARCPRCGSRDWDNINACECHCNACGAEWRRM